MKGSARGLNADVNEASEPKLPSNTSPFSPVLAPVDERVGRAREERPSVVSVVVSVGVGGVNVVGGISKVSHPAVRFLRSSSIGVVTSNPSNPAHSCASPRRSGGDVAGGGVAVVRAESLSLPSSSSWRLAIGPFTFAESPESPESPSFRRRDSRRHSTVGDMSRAGHLVKIWPITRRQLETSTASCDTNAGTARDAMDPSHPDDDDDDDADDEADDEAGERENTAVAPPAVPAFVVVIVVVFRDASCASSSRANA